MKARATLLFVLVISLALAPVLAAVPVHATGQYSERLDVYTAGGSAFWSITLDRLGASLPSITSVDSTSGLTAYRLVAMSTQSATSDFQVFGVDGYNLLRLPAAPSQGLFLMVNASSTSAASSVASTLDSQFGTSFMLVSSSGDSYTYFAPVDFVNVALPVMYRLVPSSLGGFASLVTQSTLGGLAMPFMELTGVYNGSGFTHSLSLGAETSSLIAPTTGVVDLSEVIGSKNATISTSAASASSLVVIHSLDGIITSSDHATLVDHSSNVSSSYSLSVGPGKVVRVNATISSQVPTLVAYRLLDHGTLSQNGTLGVTIEVTNSAKVGSADNVTLNDNWWQNYPGDFQMVSGNDSATIPTIAAGSTVTESYVLRVISSSALQVVIPSSTLSYSFKGSTGTLTGHATLGQNVIQLNQVGPALSLTATASIQSGTPLGTSGNYSVAITNNGNSPALDIRVDNYTVSNIAQNGGTSTITIPLRLSGLAQRNFTKTFSVEYSDTAGASQNLTTNSVQLVLSHTSMVIPFIEVATNDSMTAAALASRNLAVTYTFTNDGKGSPASVSASETFPQGIQCSRQSGIGTCSGSIYSMTTSSLTTQRNTLSLNFSGDNYIVPPSTIVASYEGMQLHTFGAAYEIPAGITVTKSFSPDSGFPGMSSVVTVSISNAGSSPVYNVTLASGFDSFDKAANSTESTQATYPELGAGASQSYTYPVALTAAAYGNVTGAVVATDFLLGGAVQGLSLSKSSVVVYAPVTATVASSPTSPEENHNFRLVITFSNTAAVSVSNVVYTLQLPSGVSVVSGATVSGHQVTVTLPSMQPNSNQNVTLTLSTNTGLTIDTAGSHLAFQYLGAALTGVAPAKSIVVSIDVTTRYTIPIAVAVLVGILAVVFARRRVGSVAKS
ncbi:MAG: hypothetical protein JRN09_01830 [Nitrososphaerota archaeon]|nr:hypothetical protein [Nitrososphaerota archaeon]